jgi:nitrite reductase (NADH) small subunit
MSEWLKLCNRTELPAEGTAKEFTVLGATLCVAMIDGKPLALDNVCPHRGGPLSEGTIEGNKVVCPWHQWEFDLATGSTGEGSDTKAITYALRQDGDTVLVEVDALQ